MESLDYLRFLLALLFVLGLIALVAWLARRFRIGAFALPAGEARRLRVVEVLPLDARRKLVLVRCHDREHLLLLGQTEDRLIETGSARRTPHEEAGPGAPKPEGQSP